MNIHCKVLLVEDEESIRKFTKVNLIRSGFTVLEAENGEEGVEITRRDKRTFTEIFIVSSIKQPY